MRVLLISLNIILKINKGLRNKLFSIPIAYSLQVAYKLIFSCPIVEICSVGAGFVRESIFFISSRSNRLTSRRLWTFLPINCSLLKDSGFQLYIVTDNQRLSFRRISSQSACLIVRLVLFISNTYWVDKGENGQLSAVFRD